MDGFFGIGFGELVLIAIVALIVLGPERLPGALREVAKFIRWMRNLSRELTDQFGDEFKALEDLNPRRILQDAITSIDEEEKTKEDPKSAKKPTTSITKTTPAKSTTTSTSGTKTTTSSAVKPKPAPPKAADSNKTVARENSPTKTPAIAPDKTNDSADVTTTEHIAPSAPATTPQQEMIETAAENRIAPPALTTDAEPVISPRINGHHPEANAVETSPTANLAPIDENTEGVMAASHRHDGEETREG